MKELNEYEKQAQEFLSKNGLKFRAVLIDSKAATWPSGHHYRVTLWRNKNHYCPGKERITFDFWGSIVDMERGKTEITPYDVLACISSAAFYPKTFEDFCGEYGYDQDSITALQTFRRCNRFAKRLQAFFSEGELIQLSEIN